MEFPRQITYIQTIAILISTVIGVGVLPLTLFAVQAADTGAPLVTILALILAIVGVSILSILGIRHPKKTIIEYSEDIIGKWLGKSFSVIIVLYFAVITALASREFGEVVITAVLRQTPLEVTVLVMLILAGVCTRNDLITFAYIQSFYLPFIVAPAVIIVVFSLKNANALYLQPVLGNEPSGMLTGILTVAALFQGFFIMTMVIPQMKDPKQSLKACILGLIFSGGLYLMIVIATVAVFGPEEIEKLIWPALELARTTSLPGNILQRLDVVFLTVWVTAVFTTLLSSYTFTIHSMRQLFRLKDHKMFSLFILPFVFVLAMIPQNTLHLYEVIQVVGRFGLLLTMGYPLLLLTIDVLRRKRGKKVEQQN
jgi:spore germination protein